MSPITGALLAALALLSAMAYRRRRERFWAALALISGGGVSLLLIRSGVSGTTTTTIEDVLLLAVNVIVAAEVIGLPAGLAARTGIGLRSREWEFDQTLTKLLKPLDRNLNERPAGGAPAILIEWRARVLRDGRMRMRRLSQLRPPNQQWSKLTGTYANIYSAHLDAIERDYQSDVSASVAQMTQWANAEQARLRAAYRAESERVIQRSLAARLLRRGRE